jgi:serine-type D-Ala-D-Ala carboxypeptidase
MITKKTPYACADVDFDPSRIEELNAHFRRQIELKRIFAANYCLSRDGKVFAEAAMGRLSYKEDDSREVQSETIQHIASITKIFTSTAIFKLVEDGYFRLCQSVGDILPEMSVPPFKDITLAQLLSHTSGLQADPNCFENKYFKSPWDYIGTMKDTPWLEAALSCGLRTKPGTEWAYSSFGFVILGEVIKRVSGMTAERFIETKLTEPCGMNDTFFIDSPEDAKRYLARCNVRDPRIEEENAEMASTDKREKTPFDDVPHTGGGLVSTASDLNRFGVMLMDGGTFEGKRVIGRRTVARMTETCTTEKNVDWCWGAPGSYRQYALGPDTRRTADNLYSASTFFHEGAGGCALVIDPEERLVASWFVPFVNGAWHAGPLYSAAAVMWSGLK